ncbi:MAG: hypothetical protein CMO65_06510 [Verrucomicrobiales bacterium]|nr:hypothetical protein [Verrucomicrobiales bacterium]
MDPDSKCRLKMGQALSGVKKKRPKHLKMSEKNFIWVLDRLRRPIEPLAKIYVRTLQQRVRAFFN